MFVQHAWGQGALRGSEVRQWLRGGGRRVRLWGARGEIVAKTLHLCCYCSLGSLWLCRGLRKQTFSEHKTEKNVWGRINILSLGNWDSVLTKSMLNFGLDDMLFECKTSMWHALHPEHVLVSAPTGLRHDVICLLKACRNKSNCIWETGISSLWPNQPNKLPPHTCALLNENHLLMGCSSLSWGQPQMSK